MIDVDAAVDDADLDALAGQAELVLGDVGADHRPRGPRDSAWARRLGDRYGRRSRPDTSPSRPACAHLQPIRRVDLDREAVEQRVKTRRSAKRTPAARHRDGTPFSPQAPTQAPEPSATGEPASSTNHNRPPPRPTATATAPAPASRTAGSRMQGRSGIGRTRERFIRALLRRFDGCRNGGGGRTGRSLRLRGSPASRIRGTRSSIGRPGALERAYQYATGRDAPHAGAERARQRARRRLGAGAACDSAADPRGAGSPRRIEWSTIRL